MCVIMAKPANVAFPEENILKNCWDNNPDMGGFMYALNGRVYIHKGFETWEKFKSALDKTRLKTGDNIPYVCHFRISTQGFDRACCQPFPLSSKMSNLKKSRTEANMGVAHNGILSLTSDGSKEYSDTMKFITDYLVNIIRSYDWHKDKRTVKLIENLIEGSRFAVLDKRGECVLLGKGWVEDKGCHFSNGTYSYKKVTYARCYSGGNYWWGDYGESDEKRWADYWDRIDRSRNEIKANYKKDFQPTQPEWLDPWQKYYDTSTGRYNFTETNCPCVMEDDDSYCQCCSRYASCLYALKASGFEY